MALRSGYKGFKKLLPGLKLFRPGTLGIDNDVLIPELNKTFFPRSEQAVLGAKNLLPNNLASGTSNGVTYTVNADLSVTLNGTATANTDLFIYGTWLSGNNNIYKVGVPYRVSMKSSKNAGYHAYVQTFVNGAAGTTYVSSGTKGNFTIASDSEDGIRVMLVVENGATFNNDVIYPMINLASDTDPTYVPYAMTNKDLTENCLKKIRVLRANEDLDNIRFGQEGIYPCAGETLVHAPTGFNGYGQLILLSYGGMEVQILIAARTIYTRIRTSAWQNWYKFEGTEVTS